MFGNYKLNVQAKVTLAVVLLIIAAAAGYELFVNNNKSASINSTSELVYADSNKGELYITDKDGKQISKTTYPKFTSLTYQAVSSNGGVLVSSYAGTDQESFIYTRNNAAKNFTAATNSQLRSAVRLQASHQMFFENEKDLLFISCPDANTTCKLNQIDLSNESVTKIIDTGVRQSNKNSPSIYLVGYLPSSHTAYVRVFGVQNKLGKATSAIYKIDVSSGKVSGSTEFTLSAGPVLALSPDGSKLAYITPGFNNNNKSTISVVDLKKGNTQTIQWDKGLLSTLPGTMKWSPDGKKLLLQTVSFGTTTSAGKSLPIAVAYIDVTKDGSVNVLQEINDPSHQTLFGLGWLDSSTATYQLKKSSKAYDFSNATGQTLKLDIDSKASSPMKVPTGDLLQAINY